MSDVLPRSIDCDVHAVLPSIRALQPYLSAYWREQIGETGFQGPVDRWYPHRAVAARAELADNVPASQVGQIQRDLFPADGNLQAAILNCDCAVESLHNPDAAVAIAAAINDWLTEEWLAKDSRLRASIVVPVQFPELAAAEVGRVAGRRGFVQVLLPARSESPYGSRNFRPLFAAAAEANLPVGIHFGGAPGNPSTPVGWPSFWIEEYAGMSSIFQTQLLSIISGGGCDAFPALKIVLLESGVSWLAPMLWRLDKNWKGLRREIPWVRKLPSEYVREHFRLTTAPFDLPGDEDDVRDTIAQLGSDDLLLYSSDYPHAHGDVAFCQWAKILDPTLVAKIASGNARALYGI